MISAKNKKILVTGAGGFIGSHLTDELLRLGGRITVLLRYTSTGHIGWLENLPENRKKLLKIVFGDIRDQDICEQAVKGNDYIFHLAAQIAIPYSYIAPRDFLTVNALGTANMLQATRRNMVKKFLQVSTSEVYGTAQYAPIDENHPQVAQSPYSASKIASDKVAESFYRSFGMPVVTIRPFNCYGPRQSARAITPAIILQALKSRTIKLGNINTRRDMNYVTDIIYGMINATFEPKTIGQTINLASGKDYSIEQLVHNIGDILGKKLTIKSEKRRKRVANSEVQRLIGDNSLAEKLFGYQSKYNLKRGLTETIRFFEKNINHYNKEDYQI